VLADTAGRCVAVLNCHLEGSPQESAQRVKQLQTGLKQLGMVRHQAVIVAGDFNCDLRSSASAAYLAFGSVPAGVLEWGREVPAAASEVPGHGYSLSSAYGAVLTDEFSFTLYGSSVWFLDQLWFTPGALRLLATRSCFSGVEHRNAIMASGLPSVVEPSDHLPIAAAFSWRAASPLELSAAAVAETKPEALDLAAEAEELLMACPLTEAQRAEWVAANTLPELPKGKRPSPEQLAELQALKAQREALLAEVDEDARAMLMRVQALQKKANKR